MGYTRVYMRPGINDTRSHTKAMVKCRYVRMLGGGPRRHAGGGLGARRPGRGGGPRRALGQSGGSSCPRRPRAPRPRAAHVWTLARAGMYSASLLGLSLVFLL